MVGPNEKVILEGTKERQGDYVFTAKEQGEYRFCFNNEMSTFAEKMVDFEIAVWLALDLNSHSTPVFSVSEGVTQLSSSFRELTENTTCRSKTNPETPSSLANRAPPLNKHPPLKSLFSKCHATYQL